MLRSLWLGSLQLPKAASRTPWYRSLPFSSRTAARPLSSSSPSPSGLAPTALEVPITAPNGREWKQPLGLFINNDFVAGSGGQKIPSINPTTEQEICSVFSANSQDVHKAVSSAREALKAPSWSRLSGSDRGALLYRLADLVEKNAETIATIESLDSGKPYSASLGTDVPLFLQVMRYYAGFADKNFGRVIDVGPDKMAYTVHEPIGVCGQIVPWNYPLAMAGWKLAPALACGNTTVLKPSELTPLSVLFVANLIREAGFPPGAVNILNGYGRDTGAALVNHPGVDKIAFTGSTATGKEIMRLASKTLKNITLETGGKSPLIVFEDANVSQAAKHAHLGIMSNSGQICTANSRLLVHETLVDEFVNEFASLVRTVSVIGDPFGTATFQGPQVSRDQYDRILNYVQLGLDEGARLALGGRPATVPSGKGYYIEPTLFADVKPNMKIFQEEIFGPCAVIVPFSTDEEAVALANDSAYGLGAMLFTKDLSRAHRMARAVEAGMVFINSTDDSDARTPFGGVKQSGIGRELGEAGLTAYCNIKTVHVNLTNE